MKKHIILLLKTLINNNACVEAARTREKKYNIIGPIFAVFALFFSALPVCVTGFQKQGENQLSPAYGFDDGLQAFFRDKKDVKLIIKEENGKRVLDMNKVTWDANFPLAYDSNQDVTKYGTKTLDNLHRYTYTYSQDNKNYLEVYFSDKKGQDYTTFCRNIINNENPYNTNQKMKVTRNDKKEITATSERTTSFIVFGIEQVYFATYSQASTTAVGSLLGDYLNTPVGTNIMTQYFHAYDQTITLKNFKQFLNESYLNTRWSSTWIQTGTNLGINAGVLALMGFVVWLTTRGKNNPFRIYTYWDSQKICFYACLTPGILGLFGFLSSSLATMLFAMSCGVRVLWLSMRTLKYTAPAK